jgi:beta-hydroxylase
MLAGLTITALLAFFSLASITYVYAFRGDYRHPHLRQYLRKCWPMFAPFNCLLYASTERRARHPIMDLSEFPELGLLRDNWQTIRDEALALYESERLDATGSPQSQGYFDIGFHTFFKYGWRKFYLKWYGYTHHSAIASCPETVRLLERIPAVHGAMFTLLPPGSKLTRHSDPFACSLRYHLGLATPNSPDCWIEIDNLRYHWRDGEALLFDETYVHHAKNESDRYRLILMCDVERPMNPFGRAVNAIYRQIMRLTVVPNDADDHRGLINVAFSRLQPLLDRGKALKESNRNLYRLLKHSINAALLLVLLAIVAGVIYLPYDLVTPG